MGKRINRLIVVAVFILLSTPVFSLAQKSSPAETIIVGIETGWPPYSFVNRQGEPDGFSVDVIKNIAQRQGFKLKFEIGSWSDLKTKLERGEIDVIPAMYYSEKRAQKINFSVPYRYEALVWFHQVGKQSIPTANSFNGQRIGVEVDGLAHEFLRELDLPIELVIFDDGQKFFGDLASGVIDFALMPRASGLYLIEQLGLSNLAYHPYDLNLSMAIALAVKKGDPTLLRALNQGLTEILGTGQHYQLKQKWLARFKPQTLSKSGVLRITLIVIAIIAIIMVMFFVWSFTLKKKVERRTAALKQETIEHKKSQQILVKQAKQQQAVAYLSSIALNSPDLKILVEQAQLLLVQTLEVNYAQFLRFYAADKLLKPIFSFGNTNFRCDNNLKNLCSNALDSYPLLSNTPLVIDDLNTESRIEIPPYLIAQRVTSCIRVSLESGSQPLGILCIDNIAPRCFNQDEINFVQVIANIVAEAITTKLANVALATSEEKFRTIFESAGVGIALLDSAGGFILVNPVICLMLGYNQTELLILNVDDITHQDEQAQTREYFAGLLNNDYRRHQTEKRYRCKDGTILWGKLTISSFDNGVVGGAFAVAMIEDISVQKNQELMRLQLEQRLRQAHKMEAIGQLTAGIAHDFNNILASMMGYTGLAQERFAADGQGKLAEYLQQVYLGGERARDLIAQMLLFSRTQASMPSELNPTLMVREVTKLLRASLPSSIDFQIISKLDNATIMIDPVQVHQVLMNLCINARDAMANEGIIVITISAVNVQQQRCASCHMGVTGDYIQISIQDTGCGMDAEEAARIFEPFFTTKDIGRGTGMGLSVVHGIVHEHDGHVIVDSSADTGSTFKLLFPHQDSNKTVANFEAIELKQEQPQRAEHILVIEAEPVLSNYLYEFLSLHGYEVTLCEDGEQALDFFRHFAANFDLIVTDLTTPQLPELELIRLLREIKLTIPIILCTANEELIEMATTSDYKFAACFNKPISASELVTVIKECLQQQLAQ